jgi:DNA invertase Pin-like site-specific DNA recombinase
VDAGWAVLIGYMRVSTAEQNLALQRDALLSAGVAPGRVYEDTCSGTVTNCPGLVRALEVVREAPSTWLPADLRD